MRLCQLFKLGGVPRCPKHLTGRRCVLDKDHSGPHIYPQPKEAQ